MGNLQARIAEVTDTIVTINLHGHGQPGQRPRIGYICVMRGDEADDVLDKLGRGGWQIIDAGNQLGLGEIIAFDAV